MGDEVVVILKDGHITLKVSKNSNILWMGATPGDVIEEERFASTKAAYGSSAMMRKTYLSKRLAGAREGLPS